MAGFLSNFLKSKSKKANKDNKENLPALNRETLTRASTRSAFDGNRQHDDRMRALQAIPNPYSVVTEPKTTRGPSSWAGVSLDHHKKRTNRAGSVYYDHPVGENRERSRRADLSMVEEFSTTSSYHRGDRDRRRRESRFHDSFTTDEDDDFVDERLMELEKANRRLHQQKLQLWQQFKKTKEELEKYRDDYDALLHQVQLEKAKYKRSLEREKKDKDILQQIINQERMRVEALESRLEELTTACEVGGAEEKLFTSSETSLDEDNGQTDDVTLTFAHSNEKMHNYRNVESGSVTGAEGEEEEEICRSEEGAADDLGLRHSQSETLLHSHAALTSTPAAKTRYIRINSAEDELAELSAIAYSASSQNAPFNRTSGSSEDEMLRLREKQLQRRGDRVKFQPPRASVKSRHYRRFGKHERSALNKFEFLATEETDCADLQSSPDLGSSALAQ